MGTTRHNARVREVCGRLTRGPNQPPPWTPAGGVTVRGAAGYTRPVHIIDRKQIEEKARPTDLVRPRVLLLAPEGFC